MKQKLLNNFRLRATLFVAMLCAAFTGAWGTDQVLTFSLNSNPGNWPTANSTTLTDYTYTLNNVDYTFALKNVKCNSGYLMLTQPSVLGLPAIENYKLTKIVASNSNSCSTSTKVGISSSATSASYIDGGEIQTWSTTGSSYTYNLSSTSANTVYYLYVTNKNAQIISLELTYEEASGSGSSAVATTTTIDASNITNTDIFAGTEAGSLSATVVDEDDNAVSGATVTWSGNNNSVATIDANTGVVTLVSPGTVTFTATYAGVKDEYASSSDTYEMTVADSTPFTGGDVTFDATTDMGTSPLTKQAVTFECNNGALNNGSEYRLYKNSVTTFSLSNDAIADGFVIKSIVFTGTGSNPASGFSAQTGWTTDGNNGTWAGAATEVSFTASGAQVRATQIVVTVGQSAALASIALSGEYPTTFHVGDAFSSEGIVVTATYEDATNKVVTESATFTGFDMATAGVQEVTVSYTENEVTKTATYDITVNAPATLTSITLSGNYPTEFQQGGTFSSEGIIVTANFDDNTSSDVTALAEFSGYDLDELGQQTVTVTYGNQTAEYTITVVEQKGTAAHPYSVAEAVAFINTLGGATSGEVYVSGIVSQVDSYNSNYSSITYWISEDGTTTGQMEVYSGKGLGGAAFSAVTDLAVGDIVTVKGNVKMYGTTPEFDKNNELVSFERPVVPSITITPDSYDMDAKAGGGELPVVCANLATDPQLEVVFVEADGVTPATYDWISAEINNNGNIDGQITANTGDARTAYFYVQGVDADNNVVKSNLVTFTQQAAATEPYIMVNTTEWNVDANGGSKTFGFDYGNLGSNPTFEVQSFESDGVTETQCGWISYEFVGDKVTITASNNDENSARTAYFKVYAEVNKTKIYSNLVTINQAGPVVDYAELPFSFDGGISDIATTDGLTAEHLGSDYGSSPKLKFNNDKGTISTLVLKINEAPGTLTFDIKGNSFKDGTFTLQTSEDGTNYTDLKTYTELGETQNESFNNLGENVRYIKWIYTTKVSGNVALGNIALATYVAPSTEPSIELGYSDINVTAAGTDGVIIVDYKNITNVVAKVQFLEADGTTPATYDYSWVETQINEINNLVYVIDENTSSEARTAYLKIYALDDESNVVYSDLITINQEGYVEATTYSLAKSITAGKHYLIVGSNSKTQEYYAMGLQNNNNRSAVQVSNNNDQISITDEEVVEVVVYGPDASGNYTIYDAETGYLYAANSSSNYLRSQFNNDLNGKWSIIIDGEGIASVEAQGDNTHNVMQFNSGNTIFSCYGSASQSSVSFYEKDNDDSEAYTANVTLNAFGYATFASDYALDFLDNEDANYSAWQIAEVNDNTNTITFEQITGMVAPATGILLKGKASDVVALNLLPAGGATLGYNKLVGITESTQVGDDQYFGLKGNEFVKVNTGVVPAGKALLPIANPTAGVKSFTLIFNDADGIQTIETVSAEKAQAIFNLAGQRLPKAQKGINIINGKKVLVK